MERGLEWECVATPMELMHLKVPSPPFVPGTSTIKIERDREMLLRIRCEGELVSSEDFQERIRRDREIPAGTFVDPSEVDVDHHAGRLHLTAMLAAAPDLSLRAGRGPARFTQRGTLQRYCYRFRTKADLSSDMPAMVDVGSEAWRSDWFINGPHSPFFTRRVKRRRRATFERRSDFAEIKVDESPTGNDGLLDHCVVDAGAIKFAVCRVPKKWAPKWAHPMRVDFLAPIPDAQTRDAVSEILSFVVGRRLMRVGSTTYDSSGAIVEEEAINPWGRGIRGLCRGSDIPPVPLAFHSDDIERALADLVPKYIALRETLLLKDALTTYWLANETFAGADLPIYAAAVGSLQNAWFESNKSQKKGRYMAQEDFTTLLGDLLAQARKRLEDAKAPGAIANKLDGAWQMGTNEQATVFFEEIGLATGAVEKAAIKARNRPAHVGMRSGVDIKELAHHGDAYRALFERTFLRLLGYEGEYVDRTSLHHPSRPIAEPCAGTRPFKAPTPR